MILSLINLPNPSPNKFFNNVSPSRNLLRQRMIVGNVEKSRQRRSHPFAVLTYWEYAPRVKQRLAPAGSSKRFAALLDGPF